MDRLSTLERSALMARIRSTDTGPELAVRRMLHRAGFRFRLHRRDLPGTPDLAFPGRRKAVFVHGCFWHSCRCRGGRLPSTNREAWRAKMEANRRRDRRTVRALRRMGWSVAVVWEHELRDGDRLVRRLSRFLA